jgi:hypothetical protein
MTPKFLREEASRFRAMAETVDREASRQRFLAMASDFEARAATAEESTDPDPHAAVNLRPGKKLATESKEAV